MSIGLLRQPVPLAARSADPTFADDVAPILFKNCATCHHEGGMAPFTVLEYDTVAAHADEIRAAVAKGQMPPWHAEGPHGTFTNDRRLSDDEKQLIVRWIDAGLARGDLSHVPPKPDYSAKWAIGTPDAIVSMQEEFAVPAAGTIDYQYFQIPTNFAGDRWVEAIEIAPGARELVHHVLVYALAPQTAPAPRPAGAPPAPPVLVRNKAQAIADSPPRADSLHAEPKQLGVLIGTYVPGTSTIVFPKGTALRLAAGTVLTLQMHYTAHGHAMNDRTSVGFRFAKQKPDEQIYASYFVNGAFTIPAGALDVPVPAELSAGVPKRVWGLKPHTHLRGVRWQYTLDQPDGSSRIVLDVPHYDFNWQTYYMFAMPLEMPAGAVLRSTAWYDNSAANKYNPDPTVDVHWGDQTWEEMQFTGILYSVVGRPVPGR
jgi:hypothetical protein